MRIIATTCVVGLCVMLCGCGAKSSHDDRPAVHAVRGKLLIDGKPAASAQVFLHAIGKPELGYVRPHATVGADGSFRLSTFATNDGAPVGEYAFTAVWPGPLAKGQGDDERGPDRLQGRYAEPKRPAARVRIDPETTELATVDLKSSAPSHPTAKPTNTGD